MPRYLLDTNILLRSADPGSPEYPQAIRAVAQLEASGEEVCLTPQNLVEFWAVATRPLAANGLGWSPAKTADETTLLLQQFPLLAEKPEVFSHWLHLVRMHRVCGKQTHDARLVAAMQAHGVTRLLTFNVGDFQRYPGITVVHPDDVV